MNNENRLKSLGVRQLIPIEEYKGICSGCNQPIFYQNFIALALGKDLNEGLILVSVENLVCPHCGSATGLMKIYGDHLPGTSPVLKPPTKKGLN
jgi:hypothetical protein